RDAGVEERLAARQELARLLADQVQDDREVVDAEGPKRVFVLADLAEVLPVAIQVQHFAELAGVDDLLQPAYTWVVEQQVSGEQHQIALLGVRDQLVGLDARQGRRLLDEDVLAGEQRAAGQGEGRDDGRRDDDRVELRVGEHLLEVVGRPRTGESSRDALTLVRRDVAEPAKLGEIVEIAREVRAPVAEPSEAYADHCAASLDEAAEPSDAPSVGEV